MSAYKKLVKKISKSYKQNSQRCAWFLYRKNRILKAQFKDFVKCSDLKLHIGCGGKRLPGYINIDIASVEGADVLMDVSRDSYLIPSGIASEIRLESVFEHFYQHEQDKILKDFFRILKKEGKLIIKWLPDFDAVIDAYINKKPNANNKIFNISDARQYVYGEISHENAPQELHKDLFTKDILNDLLKRNGFYIEEIKSEIFPGEKISVGLNVTAVKK